MEDLVTMNSDKDHFLPAELFPEMTVCNFNGIIFIKHTFRRRIDPDGNQLRDYRKAKNNDNHKYFDRIVINKGSSAFEEALYSFMTGILHGSSSYTPTC